jgi:TonB family protein
MKLLSQLFLLCLLGWGVVFAQSNTNQMIEASSCEKPEYPLASIRLEEEGTVTLKFLVGTDGTVTESQVERSSGFRRLDEAARIAFSKCIYTPSKLTGKLVQGWLTVNHKWELNFPTCIGQIISQWDFCLGSIQSPTGGLTVVRFLSGIPEGSGIEYDRHGAVLRAGIFVKGNFVGVQKLDEYKFPFNSKLFSPMLTECQGSDRFNFNNCIATIKSSNGNFYVGELLEGRMHGHGTYTYANGDNYVGSHRFGKSSGIGVFIYSDGRRYVGQFKEDKRNGDGIEYSSSGAVVHQGVWQNDKLVRSFPIAIQKWPNYLSPLAIILQNSLIPEFGDTERELIAAELGASLKKQEELEGKLKLAQQENVLPNQFIPMGVIGKRIALVVGNANYKVRPLKNPRNDADDVSRSLKATGFEVIDVRDATLPQMRSAVRQFGDRLVNNDVGLVYYSGHGVEVKGRNYFIPVTADIQREDEIADQGLDVSLILEKMSTAGKGVNILIVDACRDDPFGRSFRSSSRGLANMDAPRGTIIAYATSPGKVASDGDPRERNSPYTKHLVKAMQSPNKPIEQVFKEVRRAVQDETKNQQTPWENTSLSGDFFFRVQR